MSKISSCQPLPGTFSSLVILPTRQANALRLLLDKPVITPEEVATLDYRTVSRAPGVGKSSLNIICAWLRSHGYELSGKPEVHSEPQYGYRQGKIERAINYLRSHGYEVSRSGIKR